MSKLALLFALSLLLSACGRGPTDFYRAYNIYVVRDAQGNVLPDLAAQNRMSMQSPQELTYVYQNPTASSAEESDESSEASEDEALPDDAAAEGSLDGLSDAVEELESALTDLVDTAE
ncbi:MAG: hypothetical protein ACO1RX_06485 [Candidatus Sericytochromatia bacterium]